MRVGLVLPCNIWFAPFLKIYTRALDELNIEYDTISWNRDGKENNYGLQFEFSQEYVTKNRFVKIIPYIKYTSFVKKIVKKNKYDRLIVFTSQNAIFMHRFLRKHYKGKYIVDYRDHSIEQKSILKSTFKSVLDNCYATFVSSPGFIKDLPAGYKYYISHNFNINEVRNALNNDEIVPFKKEPLNILTIGGIRNFSSNTEVVKALANKENVKMSFVGKGPASGPIGQYANENGIKNTEIIGYYDKEDEPAYVKECSFMNIYFPRIISHNSIMSNRIYLALIYKKPIIVTSNTTQAEYVEKYNVGLSIDNCDDLYGKITNFLNNEDEKQFNERCNKLLQEFMTDYNKFMSILDEFVEAK